MHILESQGVAGAAISSSGPDVPKGSDLPRQGRSGIVRVFGCLPGTGARGCRAGRRPKSLQGGNRGGRRRFYDVEYRGRMRGLIFVAPQQTVSSRMYEQGREIVIAE